MAPWWLYAGIGPVIIAVSAVLDGYMKRRWPT